MSDRVTIQQFFEADDAADVAESLRADGFDADVETRGGSHRVRVRSDQAERAARAINKLGRPVDIEQAEKLRGATIARRVVTAAALIAGGVWLAGTVWGIALLWAIIVFGGGAWLTKEARDRRAPKPSGD